MKDENMNKIVQDISKEIQSMSGTYTPYIILTDWCKMLALSISNACELTHGELWKSKVLSQMPADTTSYEEYMQMSMMMLSMCSHIYMLKGWEKSTGANREYGYALATDISVMREKF